MYVGSMYIVILSGEMFKCLVSSIIWNALYVFSTAEFSLWSYEKTSFTVSWNISRNSTVILPLYLPFTA
jgi:hypothetical protein